MSLKKVKELNGDEILAGDIITSDYQVILPAGSVIRKEYIEKLSELAIEEVYIRDEKTEDSSILILKSEMERSVKNTVKGILERHTYQKNKELAELSMAADSIISTITEEEQVIERVYDIKERSADIYEHSISICSLAILTALKLGVEYKAIHDIGVGCLLHDIGLRYMELDYYNKDVDVLNKHQKAEQEYHPVSPRSAGRFRISSAHEENPL